MNELFLAIVNMSISASWLVLAVLLLRLVLKKAPKWVSVLLWGFVAIRLICPISVESIFSLIPSAQTIPEQVFSGPSFEIQTGIPQIDIPVNDYMGGHYFEGLTVPADNGMQVMTVLTIVWLAGIAAMLCYTAISYLLLRRKVATAVRLQENIYQSENVASPFVLGIFRPKIYLPFQMDGSSAQHVIAHERSHIRRKDHWWKPLGFMLLALHWFNPFVWLGYILLCRDIELACDEKVIQEMDSESKADYSQALLDCSVNRRSIAACPLAFGEVGVKARVKSVLNYKKPAFWLIIVAIVLSGVVAVCFLTDPMPNTLQHIEFEDLGAAKREEVWVSNGQWHTYVGQLPAETVQEVYDLPISDYEISQNRSEDRDKTHTLILCDQNLQKPEMSYLLGMYIHFNEDFTQVWVNDGVKPTLSYRVLKPEQAEALFKRIQGNRSGMDLLPKEPILGNLQTYYKNPDGTWHCNGYNYKYRLEVTGQMPNANAISTFVYLSNVESISFDRAWLAAGFSSQLSDYFDPEEAHLVEWNNETIAGTNGEGYVPAVVARDYLSGGIAKLLSFGYTIDREGQMVIACGNGPDEGEYSEENTLILDGKHGQNQILLVPRDAVLKHYCIYAVDDGVYDDGNGQANRVVQTDSGVCMATPIEPGTYIFGLELSWPELGITATYGLKVVKTGEESQLDRAIDSIMDAYAKENELIEVKLVDQYTLANSTVSSQRYLFRVQRASDAAPTWVEVEKSTGQIMGEKENPQQWLVDPPPDMQAEDAILKLDDGIFILQKQQGKLGSSAQDSTAVYLLGQAQTENAWHSTYLAIAQDAGVLSFDLKTQSLHDELYLADVDGDGLDEIIVHQLLDLFGGAGTYLSRIYRLEQGSVREMFSSVNQNGVFATGFTSEFAKDKKLIIRNEKTGYETSLDISKKYKDDFFDSEGKGPEHMHCECDSFIQFAPSDVDGDGVAEIVGVQYISLFSHGDGIGFGKTILKYNVQTRQFEVVWANYSAEWHEDYYTMEDFADVVIGQSTLGDVPDPPGDVLYVTSYGFEGVYPMENGQYIHVKFYAPDMVVGAIEIEKDDLMQEMVYDPNENLGTFSYAQDYAYYAEAVGTKLSGFVNVKPSDVKTAADAIELAQKECTVEYDSIGVAYDPDSGIYRVSFSKMFVDGGDQSVYTLGGDQGVYVDGSGITQMIHSGE